jgi:hypothetical protein
MGSLMLIEYLAVPVCGLFGDWQAVTGKIVKIPASTAAPARGKFTRLNKFFIKTSSISNNK